MTFRFKQFTIHQDQCAMKVGTDGVLLGAWAPGGRRILDAGTGTGVVALMMAQRFPEARVTAVDIDPSAARQAADNARLSPFSDRVDVLPCSLQELSRQPALQGTFDAIVSNPPYFSDSLQATGYQRTIARHAATLTYAQLMDSAERLLTADGRLSVIVPFDYRRRMEDEATFLGFFLRRVCAVRTAAHKPPRRYLLTFDRNGVPCTQQRDLSDNEHGLLFTSEELTLNSDAYKKLTQEFYLY